MTWSEVIGKELLALLDSETETDFSLSCYDGDVRCHKIVLLANGGILAEHLNDRLADNVSRLDISRLEISHEKALLILQALYGGLKDQLSENNVTQFLHFAYHFNIKWLKSQLIARFGEILSQKNVLQLQQQPEVRSSTYLTRTAEDYCSSNFPAIVEEADLCAASREGILMLVKHADTHDDFNCFKLFSKTVAWLLADDENMKSAARILSMVPLKKIEIPKLQEEVYDTIFNKLIIGKGDILTQEDKVKLASLYQDAVKGTSKESASSSHVKVEVTEVKIGVLTTRSEHSKNSGENHEFAVSNGDHSEERRRHMSSGSERKGGHTPVNWDVPPPVSESIITHIQSGEWPNMDYRQVKNVIEQENLLESEFVAVESILIWIAADRYRKQHCEGLLRVCRFSDICPVYIRCVLTTFVTEKMVGSGRLANNILRTPSTPRLGSAAPGRLAGICDNVPLSVQRLQLGEHPLTAKCSCGERCAVVLRVSRALPTAVVTSLKCAACGDQRIMHTACSSTLTPDVFPSMHLLPFHHLSRLLSSMDDIRIYLFKQ